MSHIPVPAMRSVISATSLVNARAAMGPWGDALATASGGTAARTLSNHFGDMVNVKDFGAVGDGTTDDTVAIQAAAARLQAVGGGVLFFPPGVYIVFSSTTGTLCAFTGLVGVACLGYGATIKVPTDKIITASEGYFFLFSGCVNVMVEGFKTDGPTIDVSSTTVKGYEFVRCVSGCRNVVLRNNYANKCLSGFICSKALGDPDSYRTQNILIENLDVYNCFYGINGQYSGDYMTVRNLRTDTVHRSCFIYGASNLNLEVYSKNHKSTDVPLTAAQGVAMENVYLHYYSGTDSTACAASAKVQIGFSGIVASLMRNIHVRLHVLYPGGSGGTSGGGGAALDIHKVDNSGTSDVVDRGHRLENLVVEGVVEGLPDPTWAAQIPIQTDLNSTFGTGDYFSNFVLENLNFKSSKSVYLFLAALTDLISLRNVQAPTAAIYLMQDAGDTRLPYVGRVILDGVNCLNRYAYDVGTASPPLDFIRGVGASPDTVHTGWSGKNISNDGQGGAIVWQLPAAVRGLEYTFVRSYADAVSVKPASGETHRGGAADQSLIMNSAGNQIHISCVTNGVWELNMVQGAISYA